MTSVTPDEPTVAIPKLRVTREQVEALVGDDGVPLIDVYRGMLTRPLDEKTRAELGEVIRRLAQRNASNTP